jgi:hypothetical protein
MTMVSCVELRDAYRRGERPEGPAVARHVAECEACRELSATPALGPLLALLSNAPPAQDPRLEARIEGALGRERGLRARLRALSTAVRFTLLLSLCVAIALVQAALRPSLGGGGASIWISALALLPALALLIATARATPSWQKSGIFAIAALVPAFALLGLEASAVASAGALGSPQSCFVYGALLSLPLLGLAVLFERRERVPLVDRALLGAALGLLATVVLELECASRHPLHLLLGHVSIGWMFVATLAGWGYFRQRQPHVWP